MQGRQAGRKVVVIKQLDEGTKERPYPHAIVAGIERYPRKVTRRMGTKKVQRRSRVKPFVKVSLLSDLTPPYRDQTMYREDRQLLAPLPYPLRFGIGESQRSSHSRNVQGTYTTGERSQEHQEVVRGAVPERQEQMVLPATPCK